MLLNHGEHADNGIDLNAKATRGLWIHGIRTRSIRIGALVFDGPSERKLRMAQAVAARPVDELLQWPGQGFSHVPMQVFSDPEIYRWEQDLIFRGPTWHFLGLEIEAPRPNDYFTSAVGDTPIIVVRTADGSLNALVNRCVHKGATICYRPVGTCERFTCPYHNWIYDHSGRLLSVAFEKGLPGRNGERLGGMPADFDKSRHRLMRLRVETIAGLIFGSFSDAAPPLEDYLG